MDKLLAVNSLLLLFSYSVHSQTFTAQANGNWNAGGTWNQSGATPGASNDVIIPDGFTVTVQGDRTINDVTVNTGGKINVANNQTLTINGNLTLDGEIESLNQNSITDIAVNMAGSGGMLDGTGRFFSEIFRNDPDVGANLFQFSGNTTIQSTADLTFESSGEDNNLVVGVASGVTVTNEGTVSISPELIGNAADAAWVNAATGTLIVFGPLLETGLLTASATGNTVSYQNTAAETIKDTEGTGNPYYNLIIGGGDIKTLPADVEVANLTINSTLATGNFNLTITEDWTNNGVFTPGTGILLFSDGADTDHTIGGTVTETFYDFSIAANNTVATSKEITVTNTLTLNNGSVLSNGANAITIGTSTSSIGSITPMMGTGRINGTIRRWVNAISTDFEFPVGDATAYNPISLNFDNLSSGTIDVSFVNSYPGAITSTLDDNGFDLNNTFNEGYWTIDQGNGFSTTSYSIAATANGFTSFTIDDQTRLVSRNLNGTTWSTNGAHSTIGFVLPTVQRNVVSRLPGEFTLATDEVCTLPSTTAIMGDTDVCNAAIDLYSVTGDATSTYNWEVVGGDITAVTNGMDVPSGSGTSEDPSIVANLPGVTTSEIQVTWDIPGQGYVRVTEDNTASGGCGLGEPLEVAIQINPVPTSAISGTVNAVNGATGVIYSVEATTGYTYTWALSGGGSITSGTGTNSITINWTSTGTHTLTVTGEPPVSGGCLDADDVTLDITVSDAFVSQIDGVWDNPSTWGGGGFPASTDNAIIMDGTTVTVASDEAVNSLIIESTGELVVANNIELTVNGDLTIDGTVESQNMNSITDVAIIMAGSGGTLDGTGRFFSTQFRSAVGAGANLFEFRATTTIAAEASLTFEATGEDNNLVVGLADNVVVTNLGSVTISPDLTAGNASSTWINGTNSTLAVGSNLFLSTGTLNSTATGNTVNYNGANTQFINDPLGSEYYNLTVSGSSDKRLQALTTISGDLTISSILEPSANNLSVAGNWTNTGTFNQGTTAVTFNGSSSQTISSNTPLTFYDVSIERTGNTLTISGNDVQVTSSLTISNSIVDVGTNKLIIGENTTNVGSIITNSPAIVVGQVERYINTTGVDFVFPIGTSSFDRSVTLNFNALNAGSVIAEFVESSPGTLSNPPLVDNGFDVNNTILDGYWTLTTNNSLNSSDVNISVSAEGITSFNIDEDTRLLSRSSSAADLTANGNHVDNAATFVSPIVKRENVSIFSGEYALAVNDDCNQANTSAIAGSTDICITSPTTTYSVTGEMESIYTWEVIGGTITGVTSGPATVSGTGTEEDPSTVVDDANSTTSEITITWSTGGVGTVRVTEDNSAATNGCGVGEPQTLSVQVNPVPTSAITGTVNAVNGSTGVVYSVEATSGYSYNWSLPTGGSIETGGTSNSITINWTATGTHTLTVTGDPPSCATDAADVSLDVTVSDAFVSTTDGAWNASGTWGGVGIPGATDNAIIGENTTVNVPVDQSVNSLIVEANAELVVNNNIELTVNADLTINGTIESQNQNSIVDVAIIMAGSNATLDGTGSFFSTQPRANPDVGANLFEFAANTTIASTANLSFTATGEDNDLVVGIADNIIVNNNGNIDISPDLAGGNNSRWVNEATGQLAVAAELLTNANATLDASAVGNTVSYDGAAGQNIKSSENNIYHNLQISGSDTKTLQAETTVNGSVTISSTLDPNGNDLLIQGNYDNQGFFLSSGVNLQFTGAADQTFSSSATEVLENLYIDKTSGTVTSSSNIQVTNTLTLLGGVLDMGSNSLELGENTTNEGTLVHASPGSINGSFKRFINTDQSSYVFPVGDGSNDNSITINFNDAPVGSLTAEFIDSNPGSAGLTLDDGGISVFNVFFEGYWSLTTGDGLTSSDYDVDLLLDGFSSFTTSTARVLTRVNDASDWTANGTHVAVSDGVAQRNGLSQLGAELGLGDITNCTTAGTNLITPSATVVCTGVSGVTYTASGGLSGSTYTWEVVGGSITTAGASGSGTAADPSTLSEPGRDAITVDWGSTGMVGSVQVVEDNNFSPIFGCGAGEPVVLTVNINPLPTSAITGSTSVSRSQSVAYEVEATTDYTYNWSLPSGGSIDDGMGGTPTLNDASNSITVNWGASAGTYTLSVIGVPPGGACSNADAVTLDVAVSDAFVSSTNGNWNAAGTWGGVGIPDASDNAIIASGTTVTVTVDEAVNTLNIEESANLVINNNITLTVNGDLTMDGDVESLNMNSITDVAIDMVGSGATLDGTGTFFTSQNRNALETGANAFEFGANTTIASTADLTFSSNGTNNDIVLGLDDNIIVSNRGSITVTPDLAGGTGSQWINRSGGTLTVEADLLSNTSASLDASASGNTVVYSGSVDQDIKTPSTSYAQLVVAGSGNKTMQGAFTVGESIDISSTMVLNTNTLSVEGDWTITGSLNDAGSNVSFSGSGDQTVTNTVGETFESLTLDKPSGSLILNNELNVTGTLTMTQGTVDASASPLTLGVDASTEGALAYTSGEIIGTFQRYVDASNPGAFDFPVGISGAARIASLDFAATISTGGLVSVEFVSTNPGNTGLPLVDNSSTIQNAFSEGYWSVSSPAPNNISFTSYDVSLEGESFTSFAIDANSRVLSRANSSSSYAINGTDAGLSSGDVLSRTGITTLPLEFAFGSNDTCTPPSTSAITASDNTPCTNQTPAVTYSVDNTLNSTYEWSVTGGTIFSGNGTNEISVLWGSTGGTYTVQVIEDNSAAAGGCGEGSPVTLDVNLYPLAIDAISGRTSVAEGSTGITYSVTAFAEDHEYTWMVTGGTISGGGSGVNSNSVTVDWTSVGTGSVSVQASFDCDDNDVYFESSDVSTNTASISVTVFPVIESLAGMDQTWGNPSTWNGGEVPQATNSVRIIDGSDIITGADRIVESLEIEAGGNLEVTNNTTTTVNGDLILNGTIEGDNMGSISDISILMLGSGAVLDGSGSFFSTQNRTGGNSSNLFEFGANTTIASTANLTFSSSDATNQFVVGISDNVIVTNNGAITITPDLVGGTNSQWINAASTASLTVSDDLLSNASSILNVSTAGNAVEYNGTGAQIIKTPASSQYGNLTVSGSGAKTAGAALEVLENLTVNGTADFTFNGNDFTLGGDLTNNGTITTGGNALTLNGSADQTFTTAITVPALTLNKSGSLILGGALDVTSALTMTAGDVDASSNTLALSGSTLNYTSGTVFGPFQRTIGGSPASYNFPVGNDNGGTTIARPMLVDIVALSSGGSLTVEFDPTSTGVSGFTTVDDDGTDVLTLFSEGVWRFTNAGIATTDYDLTATATDFTSFEFDASGNNRIIYDNTTNWDVDGGHVASLLSNGVQREGLGAATGLNTVFGIGGITSCPGYSTLVIAGDTETCTSATSSVYSTSGINGSDFQWTVVGGTIDEAGGLTTYTDMAPTGGNSSITVTWGATGTDAASVSVQETNSSCTGSGALQTLDVTLDPIQLTLGDVTGATAVLEGSLESYSVVNRTNYTYSWDAFGDGTFVGGVTTGPNVTINWGTGLMAPVTLRLIIDYTGGLGCTPAQQVLDIAITPGSDFTASVAGNWNNTATWGGNIPPNNANVTINQNVTLDVSGVIVGNLIIEDGVTFDNGTQSITVNGDYRVNGSHVANVAGGSVFLNGSGTILGANDGTDNTISENVSLTISDDYTIDSNADIDISGPVFINSGVTITNNGNITIESTGNIQGASSSTSVWTNAANSLLTVTGDFISGRLNASASPNTVTFNGTGAQTIPITSGTPGIQTLNLSGSSVKTIGGNVTINTVTIGAGTTLATGANSLTMSGNITNGGTLDGTGGTITIQGADKSLAGTNTFNNLNVEMDASQTLTVDPNGTITGDLAVLSGQLTFLATASETVNSLRVSNGATFNASALTDDLIINGNLTVESGATFNNPTDAVSFQGTSQQIIGSVTIDNLEKANGSTLTLTSGNTTVDTQLRLTDGNIVTSSTSLLILNDNVDIAGGSANSYVDGPLRKIGIDGDATFDFPVGDGATYGPFQLQGLSAGSNAFTGQFLFSAPPSRGSFEDLSPGDPIERISGLEYWDIERSNGSGTPIIQLQWDDAFRESGIGDPMTLLLVHFTGLEWENIDANFTGDETSGTITSINPFGSFSEFTFATTDAVANTLPVELFLFQGVANENRVMLNWATASELNNRGFEIEHSLDGVSFETIGFVEGNGTTNETQHYDFSDRSPALGYNIYRLKQIDVDGQFEYSHMISVFNDFIREGITTRIYPNPALSDEVKISVVTGDNHTPIRLSVFDMNGKVASRMMIVNPSLDENIFTPTDLVEGSYVVVISQGGMVSQERLIVR